MDPQLAPTEAQVIGVHAGTQAPFTHALFVGHVPQSAVSPPQPFAT
jgi:hypothetical protein